MSRLTNPPAATVENYSARPTGRWWPKPLLQLRVLGFGFLEDGNVGSASSCMRRAKIAVEKECILGARTIAHPVRIADEGRANRVHPVSFRPS
jgi:hypothetical protein